MSVGEKENVRDGGGLNIDCCRSSHGRAGRLEAGRAEVSRLEHQNIKSTSASTIILRSFRHAKPATIRELPIAALICVGARKGLGISTAITLIREVLGSRTGTN